MDDDLNDTPQKESKLDAFFNLVDKEDKLEKKYPNTYKSLAKNLYYIEIPQYYTWHGQKSEWRPWMIRNNKDPIEYEKNYICKTNLLDPNFAKPNSKRIGRIYFVSPLKKELFHLRYIEIYKKNII
jgi:hypothetical protein